MKNLVAKESDFPTGADGDKNQKQKVNIEWHLNAKVASQLCKYMNDKCVNKQ